MILPLLVAALTAVSPDSTVYSGRAGQLRVEIPRVEHADVRIDGRLNEPVWRRAAVLTGFTQYTPNEGVAASQRTEVLVFYTSKAIYFGVKAFDNNPEAITVHRTERDQSVTDDWFRIMLDTYQDDRSAYTFFVNPLGIQSDGMWLEELKPRGGPTGPKIDLNPDFIWQSDGRITSQGWVAEIRIPYVSIRFPERPVESWGLQFARGVTRTGFKSSWAPLTVNNPNVLSQSGTLVGLRGLEPQRLKELTPVLTGKRTGGLDQAGDFHRGGFNPSFGMDGRLGLSQNLVLDGTYNPDFSQVEADADSIEVNKRFALFFPEKRAFFLDGTEIFQTPQRLVHTRRIIDPVGGAKLTGKVGSYSVAYLGAVDRSPRTVFNGSHDAVFDLVRVRRDMGRGSSLGLLYTDRTLSGGGDYNRVLSGDLRLLFSGRYTLQTQLTGSWTRTASGNVGGGMKPYVTASLERSGRTFSANVRLDDVHPGFRALSGFVPRVGDTEVQGGLNLARFGASGATVEEYGVGLVTDNFFRHDAFWNGHAPYEGNVELHPQIRFRGDKNLTLILRDAYYTFQPGDYASYQVLGADGNPRPLGTPPRLTSMLGLGLLPSLRFGEDLQVTGRAYLQELPLYLEGSRGREIQLQAGVTYRPNLAVDLQASYTFAHLWRASDGSAYSTVHIPRIRAQYHFTETVLARIIAQYDLERRSALRDPVTGRPMLVGGEPAGSKNDGGFLAQLLLQYEPSPGTIFFVGYSRTMQGPYSFALSNMNPISDGLFAKLSYLFRF